MMADARLLMMLMMMMMLMFEVFDVDVDIEEEKKLVLVGGEDHEGKKLRIHPLYVTIHLSFTLRGCAPWEVELLSMVLMV